MVIFKKGLTKKKKIELVEDKGELLEDYPTDSFDGSNTGNAELYCFKGKVFEIDREEDGDRVKFGQVSKDFASRFKFRCKK